MRDFDPESIPFNSLIFDAQMMLYFLLALGGGIGTYVGCEVMHVKIGGSQDTWVTPCLVTAFFSVFAIVVRVLYLFFTGKLDRWAFWTLVGGFLLLFVSLGYQGTLPMEAWGHLIGLILLVGFAIFGATANGMRFLSNRRRRNDGTGFETMSVRRGPLAPPPGAGRDEDGR